MTSHSKIEQAALQLFGERGYDSTSTLLIAKSAGVSEALLFKYFQSKEKLFEYLIKQGFRRIVEANRGILTEQNPRVLIENVIDLPYKLVHDEPDFWKMQDKEFNRPLVQKYFQRFMSPIDNLLQQAFKDVGADDAEMTTQLLLLIIQSLWRNLLYEHDPHLQKLGDHLKRTYLQRTPAK
ncbi:TetR/AcrR family transcriptional regulator [Hymenobacter properus]|uniref:TetR/AcrR family transcriptional regulator n=1 Tax=Hymenobacter properus TaxID=2791026 RepID=A0A931BP41_9BACT|nr:TetR/AcrR family transcriptional regulator [Hymenobacter properus]MBF9143883.1 TetR/AcrR family transcriptional regulator [Hymenobacter properus]MBR7722697.1 TetR/AcrR family transcriptional regulator [Microvirga sp. SRT04]